MSLEFVVIKIENVATFISRNHFFFISNIFLILNLTVDFFTQSIKRIVIKIKLI